MRSRVVNGRTLSGLHWMVCISPFLPPVNTERILFCSGTDIIKKSLSLLNCICELSSYKWQLIVYLMQMSEGENLFSTCFSKSIMQLPFWRQHKRLFCFHIFTFFEELILTYVSKILKYLWWAIFIVTVGGWRHVAGRCAGKWKVYESEIMLKISHLYMSFSLTNVKWSTLSPSGLHLNNGKSREIL